MEENVKSFLDKIQEIKEQKTKVYVNSLKKEVDCLNLTFKQQKDLISTIGDGAIGALKFQKLLNDIIIENTELKDILTTDKLLIILKLRSDVIGSKIIKDDEEIDLLKVIEEVKKTKLPKPPTIKGSVEVKLMVPTLYNESKIIQVAIDSVKKEESEFGKNIGNIYTYEIVKYIESVKIGEELLMLSSLPIKDRYKIVENLPISINKEIISFIQEIKNKESDSLTYNNKVLEIDVSFFDT